MSAEFLLKESVFLNRSLYQEAERHYSLRETTVESTLDSITNEVSKLRGLLKSQIESVGSPEGNTVKVADLVDRLNKTEAENKSLKTALATLESRLATLEKKSGITPPAAIATAPISAKPAAKPDNDDDFDLFDDEEEDSEEKKRITEERVKAYAAKKSTKPALIAKSSVLLDVKVWDDETDMKALEESVRSISIDGLLWGTSKLVPVAYNIKKLQIQCVIEDDKVSTEALEEQICAFEDYVQSVDIAAFNKI